jgi:hypothetical protein
MTGWDGPNSNRLILYLRTIQCILYGLQICSCSYCFDFWLPYLKVQVMLLVHNFIKLCCVKIEFKVLTLRHLFAVF